MVTLPSGRPQSYVHSKSVSSLWWYLSVIIHVHNLTSLEMSSLGCSSADKDGRNFRAFYYETLGLRNVEQRKALEILLNDDPIGTLKDVIYSL